MNFDKNLSELYESFKSNKSCERIKKLIAYFLKIIVNFLHDFEFANICSSFLILNNDTTFMTRRIYAKKVKHKFQEASHGVNETSVIMTKHNTCTHFCTVWNRLHSIPDGGKEMTSTTFG